MKKTMLSVMFLMTGIGSFAQKSGIIFGITDGHLGTHTGYQWIGEGFHQRQSGHQASASILAISSTSDYQIASHLMHLSLVRQCKDKSTHWILMGTR